MTPKTVYREDYQTPDFSIEHTELRLDFGEAHTDVHARLQVVRQRRDRPLILDGRELQLVSVLLDGVAVKDYKVDSEGLRLDGVPDAFALDIHTRLRPQDNTSLEGLYKTNGMFCTQCEAEGFRKIIYYLDRPDVMSLYTVTLAADKTHYPVLLCNGNLVDSGEDATGRHWATWRDPFKKPSYLFAAVAGRLAHIEDRYLTRSGREVALRIYAEAENIDQCEHAMRSLKKAMRWDEDVYGLEYDLDIYMIVAVGDFNMGAMENKGLNIFNTQYVLAKPETATDSDYRGVESVVAHEYFHNWTGNRVTCRDWFQLSLKEGLTVFRDQEFSADMGSRGVKRIDDVRLLRSIQFPEDSGPMAHPVRPDSYIEINNFYTATVYNKGAEVVRMMHNLLGPEGFRKGMDLYFQRHDGQAVSCDDFVAAMEDANGADLQQFRLWYAQAGTPVVTAQGYYDPERQQYTLQVEQRCPPTPGQADKQAMHIPLAIGLVGRDGADLPLQLEGENAPGAATTRVLELRQPRQLFRFMNIEQAPLPSLLRGFSAPVKLEIDYSDDDLLFLLAYDSDDFNRWEAAQQLALRCMLRLLQSERKAWRLPSAFAEAFGALLNDDNADPALRARVLTLPSETYLAEQMEIIDVDGIHAARGFLRLALASGLRDSFLSAYRSCQDKGAYRLDAASVGRRSLKNCCLDYLLCLDNERDAQIARELALSQFRNADNMTDELGALTALADRDVPERAPALEDFYRRWRSEALVVNKWLTLQAAATLPDTLAHVQALMQHPAFSLKNPNKVRALIGTFSHANPVCFHALDGEAYAFIADQVLALNALNPQLAARLVKAFSRWRRYDSARQGLMRSQLKRILAAGETQTLSPDVYEIAAKSLDA